MVRLAEGDLAEPDGQLQLDFESGPAPIKMPLSRDASTTSSPHTVAQWYQQGLEQEANGYAAEAVESYRKALRAGGPDARTCFNLANALRELGLRARPSSATSNPSRWSPTSSTRGTTWARRSPNSVVTTTPSSPSAKCSSATREPLAHFNLADELERSAAPTIARAHWEPISATTASATTRSTRGRASPDACPRFASSERGGST
jgi:hypothetical protein